MPFYLLVKSFVKKSVEKKRNYSDTPKKFAPPKGLKCNFLPNFFVDKPKIYTFVAENEYKIIPFGF